MKRPVSYLLIAIAALLSLGQPMAGVMHLHLEHCIASQACDHADTGRDEPASDGPINSTHGECTKCVLTKALQGSGLILTGIAFLPPVAELAPIQVSSACPTPIDLGVHPGRAPPTV